MFINIFLQLLAGFAKNVSFLKWPIVVHNFIIKKNTCHITSNEQCMQVINIILCIFCIFYIK